MNLIDKLQNNRKLLIGILIGAFFVVVLLFYLLFTQGSPNTISDVTNQSINSTTSNQSGGTTGQQKATDPKVVTSKLPFLVVYGTWVGNYSVIKGYNIETNKRYTIATLPSNVKKVTVISPEEILFIGDTDGRDHGKNLSIYNSKTRKTTIVYQAADGFGIDDYDISSNNRYIATWEVSFAANSAILAGGRSRVYTLDLESPNIKHLVYDEQQKEQIPVHYPRAVLDNGDVFMDSFLPNNGAGWAYGMSKSNFLATAKEDIQSMQNGTYGSQPQVSADGKYLVFAGYDGSRGPGNVEKNGFRQAILTPNTVELYNIATNNREKIDGLGNKNIYSIVRSDSASGYVIFSALSENPDEDGLYEYDMQTKKIQRINADTTDGAFIAYLNRSYALQGQQDDTENTLGNLGNTYAAPFANFNIIGSDTGITIKPTDSFMQYIAIVPSTFFKEVPEVLAATTSTVDPIGDTLKSLQLQTFFLKPTLAPERVDQQSYGRCRDVAAAQCVALGYTQDVPDNELRDYAKGKKKGSSPFQQCLVRQFKLTKQTDASTQDICYDSPLYLYGDEGTKVNVKVNTLVYSSIPTYRPSGYDVVLKAAQQMEIDGQNHDRISYDYTPGLKRLQKPSYGKIVTGDQLSYTLADYAKAFHFNNKETADLVSWGSENTTSPYVFVSFFDEATSEQILPLSFNPKPDTYINVVFYLKHYEEKPTFNPKAPVFPEKKARHGLTAVEISGVVE